MKKRTKFKWIVATGLACLAFCVCASLRAAKPDDGYVASAETVTVTSSIDRVAMIDGASVRATAPVGIRFSAIVNEGYFNSLDGATVGCLIAKKETVGNATLTVETAGVQVLTANGWGESNVSGALRYNIALYNIPASDYNSQLVCRAFVKDGMGAYVYSDTQVTRSIAQVAETALEKTPNSPYESTLVDYVETCTDGVSRHNWGWAKVNGSTVQTCTVCKQTDMAGVPEVATFPTETLAASNVQLTGKVAVEKQLDGAYKGAYKYTNKHVGYDTGRFDYGGIWFSGVMYVNETLQYDFRQAGYKYIKVSVNVEKATSLWLRSNGALAWATLLNVGGSVPDGVYMTDENNKVATKLTANAWYNLYLPVADKGTDWTQVTIVANGGSEESPSVVYVKDVEFLTSIESDPDMQLFCLNKFGKKSYPNTVLKRTKEIDGVQEEVWEYKECTGGNFSDIWGEHGVFFNAIVDPWDTDNGKKTGSFFEKGYKWIKMRVYVENATKFSVRVAGAGLTTAKTTHITIGENLGELTNVKLYNADGSVATKMENQKWYDLYIHVDYDEDTYNSNVYKMVCIYTSRSGASAEDPTVAYFQDVTYLTALPNEIELPEVGV